MDGDQRRRRLVEAGIAITSELSLDAVLQTLIRIAAELTGARYSALGVIDRGGHELERFVTFGIGEADRAAIGELPRGRGILGVLIEDARPLRLDDLMRDPRAVGFPPNHPPMRSFLGVPVMTRGVAFGNLYLAEKQPEGSFTDEDEEIVTLLAAQAAVAIENAGSVQRDALRRAVQAQEAERKRLARELHDETGPGADVDPARPRRGRELEDRRGGPCRRGDAARASSSRRSRACGGWPSSCARRRSTTSASSRRCGALARRCARAARSTCRSRRGSAPCAFPPDVETALYRIVQEALTNAVKHAGANHVSVVVTRKATSVQVMIEDDGGGFDPARALDRRARAARACASGSSCSTGRFEIDTLARSRERRSSSSCRSSRDASDQAAASRASAASVRPKAGANLNPCPEHADATTIRPCRSRTNDSSAVLV